MCLLDDLIGAARERLPTVYSDRVFVTGGGLVSYDPNRSEQYRHVDEAGARTRSVWFG
jgi:hypothetical protein